jgi:hypothetical protein
MESQLRSTVQEKEFYKEMENTSKGPTLQDFITILTEWLMREILSERQSK